MSVDLSKIRPGDEVTVRGRVLTLQHPDYTDALGISLLWTDDEHWIKSHSPQRRSASMTAAKPNSPIPPLH